MKLVQGSLILLFVFLSVNLSAKKISEAEKRADVITKWMTEKLDLSTDQILKVKELNLECEKEIDRLTTEKAGFPCMQAVRDSLLQKENDFSEVLTETQLASYKKSKCELKEKLKRMFKRL
ncbi:hypothetical protein [Marinifilum caeruleilacunae]|uniref:Uncharacterized protein n=1 Tax=Marinifilum caeruleilacunae TaxID=2499076 RepID=A0ABX1WXR5_9BACT|nr:hypothetical protein [Marinifilum caeruleilacunae]NOU60912.1 hypothetical protein [Marinifilum caeruleilacunae]